MDLNEKYVCKYSLPIRILFHDENLQYEALIEIRDFWALILAFNM
jgi:hypothetical protein